MVKLVNRAKMTTATTGTGTITLGSAVDGYQTFANAGVADADVVRYVIEDGDAWEIGSGTYTASGTTLTRTPSESSNAGSAINLSGDAVVYVTAAAEDVLQPDNNLSDVADPDVAKANLGLSLYSESTLANTIAIGNNAFADPMRLGATAMGWGANAGNNFSLALGLFANASGGSSIAIGNGSSTTASGLHSVALGGGAKSTITGKHAYSNGILSSGSATFQDALYIMTAPGSSIVPYNTPRRIVSNDLAGGTSTNQIVLTGTCVHLVEIRCIARGATVSDGLIHAFKTTVLVESRGSPATVAIVGEPVTETYYNNLLDNIDPAFFDQDPTVGTSELILGVDTDIGALTIDYFHKALRPNTPNTTNMRVGVHARVMEFPR